jgi:hypothetical protein
MDGRALNSFFSIGKADSQEWLSYKTIQLSIIRRVKGPMQSLLEKTNA